MNWTSLTSEKLIQTCIDAGGTDAWEEFVRRFRPVIAGTVMRSARRAGVTAPDVIDDLIQETYLKICANRCRVLREFQAQVPDAINLPWFDNHRRLSNFFEKLPHNIAALHVVGVGMKVHEHAVT